MPKPVPVSPPLRNALIECFRATARLIRPAERRQLVLVGGAASVAHSSVYKTEDVDVVGPPGLLIQIWEAASSGANPSFSLEPDGKIAFRAPQGFSVKVDLIELGEGCVERIHATKPFYEGSVASVSDLLRLRAKTVVDRGSDGEITDFKWLLSRVARVGAILPVLEGDEIEYMATAGKSSLGRLDRWVLGAVLGDNNLQLAIKFIFS